MNIQITDKVGLSKEAVLSLIDSLFQNRPPKDGSFDYGFESHGSIGLYMGVEIPHPIQVYQKNKRNSDKSPIHIIIEKHTPLI